MGRKKIIILDDEPAIPLLIKDLTEDESGFEISAIVCSKNKFLDRVLKGSFDLALIDVSIKKESQGGMKLLTGLKKRGISLPVIILSAHEETDYALKSLQAGARGYINKMHIVSDLVRGCKEVVNGRLFVSGKQGDDIIEKHLKNKI